MHHLGGLPRPRRPNSDQTMTEATNQTNHTNHIQTQHVRGGLGGKRVQGSHTCSTACAIGGSWYCASLLGPAS